MVLLSLKVIHGCDVMIVGAGTRSMVISLHYQAFTVSQTFSLFSFASSLSFLKINSNAGSLAIKLLEEKPRILHVRIFPLF